MTNELTSAIKDDFKWFIFRALVCTALEAAGYDGDVWAFSEDLDMSFDEVKDKPFTEWAKQVNEDLEAYRRECPNDFITPHE